MYLAKRIRYGTKRPGSRPTHHSLFDKFRIFYMHELKLPTKHTAGVEFFRLPDLKSLTPPGYFYCIKILRPLLNDPDSQNCTPGFYLNYITNVPDDGLNSVRITYYTTDPAKSLELIQKFVDQQSDKIAIFNSQWTSRPKADDPITEVEGEELAFRNFLNTNTQISLDLLENYGLEPLHKLVYAYRYTKLPQRISPKTIFEPVFSKYSPFLQMLKTQSLDKNYWDGLMHLFHGTEFGLHFLVNIALVPESPYDIRFWQPGWINSL